MFELLLPSIRLMAKHHILESDTHWKHARWLTWLLYIHSQCETPGVLGEIACDCKIPLGNSSLTGSAEM